MRRAERTPHQFYLIRHLCAAWQNIGARSFGPCNVVVLAYLLATVKIILGIGSGGLADMYRGATKFRVLIVPQASTHTTDFAKI